MFYAAMAAIIVTMLLAMVRTVKGPTVYDRILAVNLKSAFLMTKYGYPALKARGGGVIINTASVQGLQSANLVSAGVRLVPLGQTDGQRAQAALEGPVRAATEQALSRPLEDLGTAAPMVDWTSMKHETQYTRLFRS